MGRFENIVIICLLLITVALSFNFISFNKATGAEPIDITKTEDYQMWEKTKNSLWRLYNYACFAGTSNLTIKYARNYSERIWDFSMIKTAIIAERFSLPDDIYNDILSYVMKALSVDDEYKDQYDFDEYLRQYITALGQGFPGTIKAIPHKITGIGSITEKKESNSWKHHSIRMKVSWIFAIKPNPIISTSPLFKIGIYRSFDDVLIEEIKTKEIRGEQTIEYGLEDFNYILDNELIFWTNFSDNEGPCNYLYLKVDAPKNTAWTINISEYY